MARPLMAALGVRSYADGCEGGYPVQPLALDLALARMPLFALENFGEAKWTSPPRPAAPGEWIGAEPRPVSIGGREYSLSLVFLGSAGGDPASPSIDPGLPVADRAAAAPEVPAFLATYEEFDPATRRAFLEWIDGGRDDPAVPLPFLLHLIRCLEVAMLEQGRGELATAATAEVERLLQLHGDDPDFRGSAEALLHAARLLDPDRPVPLISANGRGNPSDQMPFAERLYLGQALKGSSCLEADPALLFLLQRPRTWLDTHVVLSFPLVYHHWTENYSHRFNGGVELQPTSTLSLSYQCLDGETEFELSSSLPDPASAPVPPELQRFFDECCAEADALRDLPIAQQNAIIKGVKSSPGLRGAQPAWSVRPDFEERISGRLAGRELLLLRASDLLSDLFEDAELSPNKQLPAAACRRMCRALGDIGVGFEPDDRYGLPMRIRPDRQLALFLEESLPFQEPSDAFHLAQAAMVLSAIGTRAFAGLEPLRADRIEPRLPYRVRFSERELRRLEASFLVMSEAGKPRELLASWPRRMKRLQRLKHIELGFGIAFHAQAGNPLVKRFATAVSKALHNDDRRVDGFLREVKAQADGNSDPARLCSGNIIPSAGSRVVAGSVDAPPDRPAPVAAAKPEIDGLSPVLADILRALVQRPRSRTELNDIARRGRMQLAGALEELNEWSLARLDAHVTRGHQPVRVNPELFDAVELIVRPQ